MCTPCVGPVAVAAMHGDAVLGGQQAALRGPLDNVPGAPAGAAAVAAAAEGNPAFDAAAAEYAAGDGDAADANEHDNFAAIAGIFDLLEGGEQEINEQLQQSQHACQQALTAGKAEFDRLSVAVSQAQARQLLQAMDEEMTGSRLLSYERAVRAAKEVIGRMQQMSMPGQQPAVPAWAGMQQLLSDLPQGVQGMVQACRQAADKLGAALARQPPPQSLDALAMGLLNYVHGAALAAEAAAGACSASLG